MFTNFILKLKLNYQDKINANDLTKFLKDEHLEINSNSAENFIRPLLLDRKNWLFAAIGR